MKQHKLVKSAISTEVSGVPHPCFWVLTCACVTAIARAQEAYLFSHYRLYFMYWMVTHPLFNRYPTGCMALPSPPDLLPNSLG